MEILTALLGALMLCGSVLAADSPERHPDEYEVKAAFLYNFARFVDWPPEAFRVSGAPFSICVLGDDPFGGRLDGLIAGKSMSGRPIAVRRVSGARQTDGCQILFVSFPPSRHNLSVLETTRQTGILSVGDTGIKTSEGVVVAFTMENGKVHFEINAAAAERNALHVSARLLSLAHVVNK